jgi:hypothetical protein
MAIDDDICDDWVLDPMFAFGSAAFIPLEPRSLV